MSLKRMAIRMAIAFAAGKGYQAYRQNGGMSGVKRLLSGGGSAGGGGLGGLMSSLGGGRAAAGGGLLGGLAAMSGGAAATRGTTDDMLARAETGPEDDSLAAVMIRAMGQAVRADGEIDASERAALDEVLGDADTPEDEALIHQALSEPIHPEALARDVPRGAEAQVYAAALTAIDPDHPAETDFLRRFASALALSQQDVTELHHAAGKPI